MSVVISGNDPIRIIGAFILELIWGWCLWRGGKRVDVDGDRLAGYAYFGIGFCALAAGLLLLAL